MPDAESPVRQLLARYADDHRHPLNQRIHQVCVPLILWSVVGLTWPLRFGDALPAGAVTLGWMVVVSLYYLRLSPRLAAVMVGVLAAFAGGTWALHEAAGATVTWGVAGAVFAGAWVGQFVGHAVEGRRPSFLTDLQYLLIGPLWVVEKRLRLA